MAPRKLLQVTALLLCMPVTTWALDTDRSQPIHIEADRATLNEHGEKSSYEGNVQLRQGTLNLRGNRMTVYLANKQVDRITLTGKPATLQQRQDNNDTDQHAEAENIEYNATDERVILLGNARIWQTGEEEFRSERIVFNLKDNTVNAGGVNTRDRVHIILPPKISHDNAQQESEQ
jgi:lipopolysaccharide export system protein LptA